MTIQPTSSNARQRSASTPRNTTSLMTAHTFDAGCKNWILFLIILLACCGATWVFAQNKPAQINAPEPLYRVSDLNSLGGTNSRGNSINNRAWISGYSNLAGNQRRHAALWRNGILFDLGTLGGPNSSVTWNVKNERGLIVGIAQTALPQPLGEAWSSAAFYPGPLNTGFINLGFVWENGVMRALPTLGGDNGFATGCNNSGHVVGWTENTFHDPECVAPQVLQFRPVVWEVGRSEIETNELPLIAGDTSGAATAINNNGQVVGISGICDQAVGRHTAKHAVLWQNDSVTDIGDLGAPFWNTPTAINERGDVVGFAGTPNDPDGNIVHAFIWTKDGGIRPLGELPGHVYSEASGINERRQVVGLSCDADFVDCRAYLWENGVMRDLNELKAPGYSARLDNAKDINDKSEITGRSTDPTTGMRKAFFATPVAGQ